MDKEIEIGFGVLKEIMANCKCVDEALCVKNNAGDTVFHCAVGLRNVEIGLRMLKEMFGNSTKGLPCFMIQNNNGETPLMMAIKYKNLEMVKLLSNKCDDRCFMIKNKDGNTVFHCAGLLMDKEIEIGFEILKEIMANCKCLDEALCVKNNAGDTVFHCAVGLRNVEIGLRMLKEMFGNSTKGLCVQNKNGETPLIMAVRRKNLKIVEFMCNDPCFMIQNNAGDTIFHWAVTLENDFKFRVLEEILANCKCLDEALCVKNKAGDTVFHWAVTFDQEEIAFKMLEEMLGYSAKGLCIKNKNDETPLMVAIQYGTLEMVKLFSNKCDDICFMRKNKDGNTAFHLVVNLENGFRRLTEMLGNSTKGLCVKNNDGETPLMMAIKYKDLKMVKLLCDKCDDRCFMIKNKDGNTVFHLVVSLENEEGLEMLEEMMKKCKRVDKALCVENEDGKTPLTLAIQLNKLKMVKLLRDN
eukprot:TRINITY_DN2663_c0_g1_i2.p1 TRINITY_DN2663_c0_g1~~TRINITY_DN2663_c0_g1_i2.p1  ORF type:complete len:468 (-),score=117.19 TRINITY_DN2663_c0_g1_i2:295-1698(-)